MTGPQLCVAVLGLGEAGSLLSADLVRAGARVRGYDPAVPRAPAGAVLCDSAAAARGADVVLSVNSAAAAHDVLRAGLPGTGPHAVWTDLNTSAGSLKRALAATAAAAGVAFADVALLAPVPGRGLRTPMLASGPAASRYADLMGRLGIGVTLVDGPAGAAADRKLLRSVFVKGMTAALLEALAAARAMGCEDWLRDNAIDVLTLADASLVDRMERGKRGTRPPARGRDGGRL